MKNNRITVLDTYLAAGDAIGCEDSKFHTRPSVTRCSDGSFLCCALVGSTKDGPDARIKVYRSADSCKTWKEIASPIRQEEQADQRYGHVVCHITELDTGCLVAVMMIAQRFNPEEPLFHPETDGMQPCELKIAKSSDNGGTWTKPRMLDYHHPDVIVPQKCVILPGGNLGIPCEIWHEWDKGFREGPSARLILSYDKGESWPEAAIMAKDDKKECLYGDPRLTILPDSRIVAFLWRHNFKVGKDLPVHRVESADMGATWSRPCSTDIEGQIANPVSLADGLMLCVYQKRFGDDAGLKAILSYDDGRSWDRQTEVSILTMGHHVDSTNPFSGYDAYTFGTSSVLKLSASEVLVSFWASNGKATCIRMLRVQVNSR